MTSKSENVSTWFLSDIKKSTFPLPDMDISRYVLTSRRSVLLPERSRDVQVLNKLKIYLVAQDTN